MIMYDLSFISVIIIYYFYVLRFNTITTPARTHIYVQTNTLHKSIICGRMFIDEIDEMRDMWGLTDLTKILHKNPAHKIEHHVTYKNPYVQMVVMSQKDFDTTVCNCLDMLNNNKLLHAFGCYGGNHRAPTVGAMVTRHQN